MNQGVVAFFCGVIFALGLGISGMTEPARVSGFLDLFGNWDPTLLWVMGGAVLVYSIGYRLVLKKRKPVLTGAFHVPHLTKIDRPLVVGSLLFGIGWGLVGYCPGPALTAFVTFQKEPVIFVVSMVAAMNTYALVRKKRRN